MTDVEIINIALYNLGLTQTITARTDASKEARVADRLYDHTRELLLTRFWAKFQG